MLADLPVAARSVAMSEVQFGLRTAGHGVLALQSAGDVHGHMLRSENLR
jgi:hypothetical protein